MAEHAARVALEKSQRRAVKTLQRPTYDLPLLTGGVDLGALYQLAEHLCRQGTRLREEVEEAIHRQGLTEFVFVMAPLRIAGGTGSPIGPVAVVAA